MSARPILFSGPMVRALLAGTKTQTRRIAKWGKKPIPPIASTRCVAYTHEDPGTIAHLETPSVDVAAHLECPELEAALWPAERRDVTCPYGQPGDRLWVRETFTEFVGDHVIDGKRFAYSANCTDSDSERIRQEYIRAGYPYRWKPSIHMPRAASRITLEIAGVRVERLNAISQADACAEGCDGAGNSMGSAFADYVTLWESINGPGSWDANPWVWMVEFRKAV